MLDDSIRNSYGRSAIDDNVMDSFDRAFSQAVSGRTATDAPPPFWAEQPAVMVSDGTVQSVAIPSDKNIPLNEEAAPSSFRFADAVFKAAKPTVAKPPAKKVPAKKETTPTSFQFTDSIFRRPTTAKRTPNTSDDRVSAKQSAASYTSKSIADTAVTSNGESTRDSEVDTVMAAYGNAFGTNARPVDRAPFRPNGESRTVYQVAAPANVASVEDTTMAAYGKALNTANEEAEARRAKYDALQQVATWKSNLVGAIAGVIAIAPFTALHHLYFFPYPDYPGLSAWEWDTVTAAIQGAVYASVYRYSLREDIDEKKIRDGVFIAFVLVRTIVRTHIPLYCSALPLQCGEPLGFLDWSMLGELSVSYLESVALFGIVGGIMDWVLREKIIRPFPNQ